ncbi:MAG: hypothetical protein HC796_10720 [Synechococcaceae cyanobacterium RL_1_2]|nr:hypothetical protein [Synechococcaceae cyanobacterium RL_1_2]
MVRDFGTKEFENLQIKDLRRSLQRSHIDILESMALGKVNVNDDAQILARYHLQNLDQTINQALNKGKNFNTYTQAHLENLRDRIEKIFNAPIPNTPNIPMYY